MVPPSWDRGPGNGSVLPSRNLLPTCSHHGPAGGARRDSGASAPESHSAPSPGGSLPDSSVRFYPTPLLLATTSTSTPTSSPTNSSVDQEPCPTPNLVRMSVRWPLAVAWFPRDRQGERQHRILADATNCQLAGRLISIAALRDESLG